MGTDKALLETHGRTLLQHVCDVLQPHVSACYLATGSEARYAEIGWPCLLDQVPEAGPLGGLHAALLGSATPWVLLVAVDMPALDGAILDRLMQSVETGDQVVQFGNEDFPEPLCALYHRSVLPAVEAALNRGDRRMISFLGGLKPGAVRWLGSEPKQPGMRSLENVNGPSDWTRWRNAGEPGA